VHGGRRVHRILCLPNVRSTEALLPMRMREPEPFCAATRWSPKIQLRLLRLRLRPPKGGRSAVHARVLARPSSRHACVRVASWVEREKNWLEHGSKLTAMEPLTSLSAGPQKQILSTGTPIGFGLQLGLRRSFGSVTG
jgi:hypothetical protein